MQAQNATATHACNIHFTRHRFGQAFFTDVVGNVYGNAGSGGGGDGLKIQPEFMETDAVAAPADVDNSLSALLCGDDDDDNDDGYGDGDGDGGWRTQAPKQTQGHELGQMQEEMQGQMMMQGQKVQERSIFSMCGDGAVTTPAHASANMQRTMEDAMPEYDRLQRAVDG